MLKIVVYAVEWLITRIVGYICLLAALGALIRSPAGGSFAANRDACATAYVACRTLIVEFATPAEVAAIGRQGPALLRLIPNSLLVTFEESDGLGLTLDNRAEELAAALESFLGST